jgi:hypothetical protein
MILPKKTYKMIQSNNEPTELKMQPTIHLQSKIGYLPPPNPALRSKCIVGCFFSIQPGTLLLVNHLVDT